MRRRSGCSLDRSAAHWVKFAESESIAAAGGAMSGIPESRRPTSAVGRPQPRNVANGTCTQCARVAEFATSWWGTAAQKAATDPGPISTGSPPNR